MFIIDLDYTLYRTELLVRDMKKVFLEFGIDEEGFKDSYKKAILWKGNGYGFDYSFEKHITLLQKMGHSIDSEDCAQKLRSCIKTAYLCSDTIPFLKFLRARDEEVALMTAGNLAFQKMKVQRIGLEEYFDHTFFLNGNKDAFIKDLALQEDRIIVINDNHKENTLIQDLSENVHVIGKRNPIKYFEDEQTEGDIPYFDTLTEIQDYVRQTFL